jgi:hypothetical protein
VSLKLGIREIAYFFLISSSPGAEESTKGFVSGHGFSHAFSFSAIAIVTAEPN